MIDHLIEMIFYASFAIVLAVHIKSEHKNEEKIPLALIYACFFWFLMYSLALSIRIVGFIYPITGLTLWRVQELLVHIGLAGTIYAIERTVLLRRTKYAFTIFVIATSMFQTLYPTEDFSFVAGPLSYVSGSMAFLIILVFAWLGVVSPGLRKICWSISAGMVVFSVGLVWGSIWLRVPGLFGVLYGMINFRLINKAAMDYYRAKKICLVHRGKIQGAPFMCAACGVLYCGKCKEAIVRAENRCWNCKAMLDASARISFQVRASDAMFQKFASIKDGLNKETDLEAFRTLLELGDLLLNRRRDQALGEMADEVEEIITKQPVDAMVPSETPELEQPVNAVGKSKNSELKKKILGE